MDTVYEVSPEGSVLGPCRPGECDDLKHPACSRMRRLAAVRCIECRKALGYAREFTQLRRSGRNVYRHVRCED